MKKAVSIFMAACVLSGVGASAAPDSTANFPREAAPGAQAVVGPDSARTSETPPVGETAGFPSPVGKAGLYIAGGSFVVLTPVVGYLFARCGPFSENEASRECQAIGAVGALSAAGLIVGGILVAADLGQAAQRTYKRKLAEESSPPGPIAARPSRVEGDTAIAEQGEGIRERGDTGAAASALPNPAARKSLVAAYSWAAGATILPYAAGGFLLGSNEGAAALLMLGALAAGPSAGQFYAGSPATAWLGLGIRVAALPVGMAVMSIAPSSPVPTAVSAGLVYVAGLTYSLAATPGAVERANARAARSGVAVSGMRTSLSPALFPLGHGRLAPGLAFNMAW